MAWVYLLRAAWHDSRRHILRAQSNNYTEAVTLTFEPWKSLRCVLSTPRPNFLTIIYATNKAHYSSRHDDDDAADPTYGHPSFQKVDTRQRVSLHALAISHRMSFIVDGSGLSVGQPASTVKSGTEIEHDFLHLHLPNGAPAACPWRFGQLRRFLGC